MHLQTFRGSTMYVNIVNIFVASLLLLFSKCEPNTIIPTSMVFQSTWFPISWYFEISSVGSRIECVFSLLKQDRFAAFNFKQGKCYLYMIPGCLVFNHTSLLRQSENTTQVFITSDGMNTERSQTSTRNLARGE